MYIQLQSNSTKLGTNWNSNTWFNDLIGLGKEEIYASKTQTIVGVFVSCDKK